MGTPKVEAIQVGSVALRVPPGSMVALGTAGRALVIVLVFGGEELVVMESQGVTCSERTYIT